jgi:hypothetical protein
MKKKFYCLNNLCAARQQSTVGYYVLNISKKIVLILLLFQFLLQAEIINVPADCQTIRKGISLAESGDTVLVAPNIYNESFSFMKKSITVASWYLTNHDSILIDRTVINLLNDPQSWFEEIKIIDGEDNRTVFCGFTIRNGRTGAWYSPDFPWESDSEGGALTVHNSSPVLTDLVFRNNSSGCGSAINFYNSAAYLYNIKLFNNTADVHGGGICCLSSDISCNGLYLEQNYSHRHGGGINILGVRRFS